MSLPLNIPSIIGQVVTNTATAMGIPIQYKHGTWQHIRERITTENGGYSPNQRFPLVCLVQVFEEKFKADSEYSEASLTLLICNNSQPTWYSEDRYTNNYLPTLYPIYAELMEQLNQTPEIVGYKTRYFEHTKVDDLHLPENNANKLPECLDGLWIQDLKLTFNVPPCSVSPATLCSQTPCPNGAVVDYVRGITAVAYTHVNSHTLTITPTTIGTGALSITIPSGGGTLTGSTLNVTGATNGLYTGLIQFGTATHQFFYEVKNGNFEHYPKSFSLVLTPNTNCYNYVLNNGYRISYQYTSEYHNINTTAFESQLDATQIVQMSVSPTKLFTDINSASFQVLTPINLSCTLTLSNGTTLTNNSFIKLKCQ